MIFHSAIRSKLKRARHSTVQRPGRIHGLRRPHCHNNPLTPEIAANTTDDGSGTDKIVTTPLTL
jgi:hypothetical protein